LFCADGRGEGGLLSGGLMSGAYVLHPDLQQRVADPWANGQAYHTHNTESPTKLLINGESGHVHVREAKGHPFDHLLNYKVFFPEPPRYTTCSIQSHQQSTAENTLCFASYPSLLFKRKLSMQK